MTDSLVDICKKALASLEAAPHKHRIDFDPYWWWWDSCQPTIKMLHEVLGDGTARVVGSEVGKRSDVSSTERDVDSSTVGGDAVGAEKQGVGEGSSTDAADTVRSSVGTGPAVAERDEDAVTKALKLK
jgi:hypothetical protein